MGFLITFWKWKFFKIMYEYNFSLKCFCHKTYFFPLIKLILEKYFKSTWVWNSWFENFFECALCHMAEKVYFQVKHPVVNWNKTQWVVHQDLQNKLIRLLKFWILTVILFVIKHKFSRTPAFSYYSVSYQVSRTLKTGSLCFIWKPFIK